MHSPIGASIPPALLSAAAPRTPLHERRSAVWAAALPPAKPPHILLSRDSLSESGIRPSYLPSCLKASAHSPPRELSAGFRHPAVSLRPAGRGLRFWVRNLAAARKMPLSEPCNTTARSPPARPNGRKTARHDGPSVRPAREGMPPRGIRQASTTRTSMPRSRKASRK